METTRTAMCYGCGDGLSHHSSTLLLEYFSQCVLLTGSSHLHDDSRSRPFVAYRREKVAIAGFSHQRLHYGPCKNQRLCDLDQLNLTIWTHHWAKPLTVS